MTEIGFVVVAVAIVGFALISGRVQNTVITPPIAFVVIGALFGPFALDLIELDLETQWVHLLAELTLIVVLFTDASRIDVGVLRRQGNLPTRMLLIGLPLTVVLGTGMALALFDNIGVWMAAVLATILAPTDAALGQAVVSDARVPVRIRQTINVESGLNDGIMVPVLLILVSCAGAFEEMRTPAYWFQFAAKQVTLGPLVGIAIGWLGAKAVEQGTRSRWMSHSFQQLCALGLALLAYGLAEVIGGNGFIAAFMAGLTLGNTAKSICECLVDFGETEGQLLTLLIFLVFGVVMVPLIVAHVTPMALVYALASLTIIRMIPVMLSLVGTRLHLDTVLFLGWFGPRGIASILFLLVVIEEMLPGSEELIVVVATTVLLSIFAHGFSAAPAVRLYSRRVAGRREAVEHAPVDEMAIRIRPVG